MSLGGLPVGAVLPHLTIVGSAPGAMHSYCQQLRIRYALLVFVLLLRSNQRRP